jgi:hypothetical protein
MLYIQYNILIYKVKYKSYIAAIYGFLSGISLTFWSGLVELPSV